MSASALKTVATGRTAVAENPAVAFRAMLESRKGEIAAALPKHITPERVIRLALTEFSKNPGLRECTAQSIYAGIIQASQLGLEIGVLGQAYLVPYNNKVKKKGGGDEWRKEAQFIPGYKGLISLARRSGEVTSIETHIVYENDHFDLTLGIESKVEHKPHLLGDRGAPRLVYGVAHFKDGGYHFEWMTVSDVAKIRNRSKSKDSGPWVTDFDQMMRKTLIRRMANYLPMSIEFAAALQVDEAVSAGRAAAIEGDFAVVTAEDNDTGGEGAPGEAIDKGTGEVTQTGDKPAQGAGAPPVVLTFADVSNKFQQAVKANDVDLLDAHATLIHAVEDAEQRNALTQEYEQIRAELVAAADKKTARK
jgi:recombination protein RecT